MSMFKPIRWLACVTAVGIAVLGWASPSRADLEVTLSDTATGQTGTFLDNTPTGGTTTGYTGTLVFGGLTGPGNISLSGIFGNFQISNLGVVANYNVANGLGNNPSSGSAAIPPPGSPTAYVTNDTITATKVGVGADTLTVTVAAGNWTIPSGSPLTLTNGQTSSQMTGSGDTSAFQSTFTSQGVGGSAQSSTAVTLTGPFPPGVGAISSPNLSVTNPNSLFALANKLTLTFGTGGNAINVDGTTTVSAVPEPSTLAIAGLGALGMIGYGIRRRKALGA